MLYIYHKGLKQLLFNFKVFNTDMSYETVLSLSRISFYVIEIIIIQIINVWNWRL